MLRPILATAFIVLLFATAAFAGYWGPHTKDLTALSRGIVLFTYYAMFWTCLALGWAHFVLTYCQPGQRWRMWWRMMAGFMGFIAVLALWALVMLWLLRPLVGDTISKVIYFGGVFACVQMLFRHLQRRKKHECNTASARC